MIKSGESFIKQTLSFLTNDIDEVKATKAFRKAIARVSSTISSLKYDEVNAQQKVEEKLDELNKAIFTINVDDNYTKNISIAQTNYDIAIEKLEEIQDSIVYWKEIYDKF